MIDIYFGDELHNRLTALEAAAELYQGEFRRGVLFALGLVRLSLGLTAQLTIPYRMEANYERAVECETGDGGILGAVVGDCSGIRPSDGRGTCADIGETNQRNGGERWIT